MSVVQAFDRGRKEVIKAFFAGSEEVPIGAAVCFDRTVGDAEEADEARGYRVVKPASANFDNFAGIVSHKGTRSGDGAQTLELLAPTLRGSLATALVDADCTIDDTELGLTDGEWHLSAASSFRVARAMQTKDTSGDAGLVSVALGMAGYGSDDS